MLKFLLLFASFANCAGGLVLIAPGRPCTNAYPSSCFLSAPRCSFRADTRFYIYRASSIAGAESPGAMFAGEGLAACVGAAGLIQGIIHNMQHDDMEMAPVLAGFLMLTQAVLALIYLVASNKLRPAKIN